jgi:general stress protein 26
MIEQACGIGVLAIIEDGKPCLRPMEFSLVDGELWAAASKLSHQYTGIQDGQHVEVLFMNEDFAHARVRGVLEWSATTEDCQRLWELQLDMPHWFHGVDDPNLVILKVLPEEVEFMLAHENEY